MTLKHAYNLSYRMTERLLGRHLYRELTVHVLLQRAIIITVDHAFRNIQMRYLFDGKIKIESSMIIRKLF